MTAAVADDPAPDPQPPGTVGILGLGLIGGSLALDLVGRGRPVVGWDPDRDHREAAAAAGVDVLATPEAVASDADVVVVAVPPPVVDEVVTAVGRAAGGAVVTDVTSVKAPAALGFDPARPDVRFVGGHPMAGTERTGFAAARRGLLAGAPWLLTPHDDVDTAAFHAVVGLVLDVDAVPVVLDADEHDLLVAAVSHVPHLVAYGVHAVAGGRSEPVLDLVAGPSFRDATRVAASAPVFWADLLARNAAAVHTVLQRLQDWLDAAAVEAAGQGPSLHDRLAAARRAPSRPATDERRVDVTDVRSALSGLRRLGRDGYAVTGLETRGGRVLATLARR